MKLNKITLNCDFFLCNLDQNKYKMIYSLQEDDSMKLARFKDKKHNRAYTN